jgi:hypothetical protein
MGNAAFFISIILGSAESDLYWSVGATFIQIIDESAFIHPNVCTFIQNIAIERFHQMISSNILPNILPKKFTPSVPNYLSVSKKVNVPN